MAARRVVRPIVRSFQSRFAKEAAAHVKKGGHALVWDTASRVRLAFRVPPRATAAREKDLGYWSLLDLGVDTWSVETKGALRGLAVSRIAKDSIDIVRHRAERDSIHPRATRAIELDCETCAACCRDNKVILEPVDFDRFAKGGRPELGRPPYTRKDGERVVLRLLRSRDCKHLGADKRCGIYSLRPESCRSFPAGSESCLYSREAELGVVDGASEVCRA
jgi:Fe-S-cluster containining protein